VESTYAAFLAYKKGAFVVILKFLTKQLVVAEKTGRKAFTRIT
jgi:hypothetical protein